MRNPAIFNRRHEGLDNLNSPPNSAQKLTRPGVGPPAEPASQLTRLGGGTPPAAHQAQRRQAACRVGFGTWAPAVQLSAKRWADQRTAYNNPMVDERARAAERKIDNAYQRQPLLSYPYEDALRSTFVAVNALLFRSKPPDLHIFRTVLDTVINALKYAIGWIWTTRVSPRLVQPGGDPVRHAVPFIRLAIEYLGMVTAYSHASDNLIDLTCEGHILRVAGTLLQQQQYEAYNELIKSSSLNMQIDLDAAAVSAERISAAITSAGIRGVAIDRVPLDHQVLAVTCDEMARHRTNVSLLPSEWRFRSFSLVAFRTIHGLLRAIVYVWSKLAPLLARAPWFVPHAAHQPFLITRGELLSAAVRVGGLSKVEARSVLNILEYAGAGMQNPDPALQPLVLLPNGRYLLSEPLIADTAAERNLAVLLNRIPAERDVYSRLTNQKEAEMRSRITRRIGSRFELWHGKLRGNDVTNVDLAIVDDREQSILFLELKWFIEPAEVRELRDRSEDLSKGIAQCKTLLALATDNPGCLARISRRPFCIVAAAVVSANWVGLANIQDCDIPIITEEHLVLKLEAANTLSEVIAWLRAHAYLPVAGRDYMVVDRPTRVEDWTLEWYRIERVGGTDFMPL